MSEPSPSAFTARGFLFMNFVEDSAERFRSRHRASWIELVVAIFIEPRTSYVEQFQAGHEARQRERINGELGDGFIGAGIDL